MFGHNMNGLSYDYSSEFQSQSNSQFLSHLVISNNEHDSLSILNSPNSITSYGTYNPSLISRSISNHSLQNNFEVYSPMHSSPPSGFFEYQTNSIRKVLSTDDLKGVNLAQHRERLNSPLSNENSIIESMSRASPYSPEEKKERIERYRSKKNLRNFNKKIKYECRKTLADSRPRIRGRFARNDEIEKIPQWDQTGIEEEDDDDNWIDLFDAFSANLIP